MDQQQHNSENEIPYFGILLALLLRSLCATVEVFLHKPDSFGERYAGLQVGVGFLLILLYPVFYWQGHDPTGLLIFLVLYVLMLMWVRLKTFLRVRRGGHQPHTLYAGTPRLSRIVWRFSEETIKRWIEPIFVIFIGGLLVDLLNEPLGGFLMIAGFALLATTNLAAGDDHRRVMRMNDSYIQQKTIIQQFKNLHK